MSAVGETGSWRSGSGRRGRREEVTGIDRTDESDGGAARSTQVEHEDDDPGARTARARRRSPRAIIDTDSLRWRWYRTADRQHTTVARDFKEIKRPLLARAWGRGSERVPKGRRIMVTSALPREGKTFCAINLALSIAAERDRGVILVDADLARPSVPKELGIEAGAGLVDWLLDEGFDVEQVVRRTNIKRFQLLTAGHRHPRATELLTSDAMDRLLHRLDALYPEDIFVFDSSPLLATSESAALADHVGQVVMVVASGETTRASVSEALDKLPSGVEVGMILNKVPSRRLSPGYET